MFDTMRYHASRSLPDPLPRKSRPPTRVFLFRRSPGSRNTSCGIARCTWTPRPSRIQASPGLTESHESQGWGEDDGTCGSHEALQSRVARNQGYFPSGQPQETPGERAGSRRSSRSIPGTGKPEVSARSESRRNNFRRDTSKPHPSSKGHSFFVERIETAAPE